MRKFNITFEKPNVFGGYLRFENDEQACKYIFKKLSPHCSINFLWTLREFAAKEIKSHNKESIHQYSIDREK